MENVFIPKLSRIYVKYIFFIFDSGFFLIVIIFRFKFKCCYDTHVWPCLYTYTFNKC